MGQFVQAFGHIMEIPLSGDQWDQFVTATDTLVGDLEKIKVWAPASHPTSHWKRRQGKSKQRSGDLTPPQGRHALSSNTTTTTTIITEDNDQTQPTTITQPPATKPGRAAIGDERQPRQRKCRRGTEPTRSAACDHCWTRSQRPAGSIQRPWRRTLTFHQSVSLATPPAGCHQSMHLPAPTSPISSILQR